MSATPTTIGIVSAGEMGQAVAVVLRGQGHRVVTTLSDRSEQTAQRCNTAGIEVLSDSGQVVHEADVFMSLVPPSAAAAIAGQYCRFADSAPNGAIYVDLNSIGPQSAIRIAERLAACGVAFVDGAINGLAKNLQTSGTLFLSGSRARDVAALFNRTLRTEILGERPGQASAMKMFLSGLSKGICALFVESALAAEHYGMLDAMTANTSRIYPQIMAIVERLLPTYAEHAARRAVEMRELEQTIAEAGLDPCVMKAVRKIHDGIAGIELDAADAKSIQSLIAQLSAAGVLAQESADDKTLTSNSTHSQFVTENNHGQQT